MQYSYDAILLHLFPFRAIGKNSSLGEHFSIMGGMTYRRSSHSVYDIEYHIVFYTKYRYRVLYS